MLFSGKAQPVASFKWHTGPVTSVEWHPTEESVIAVSGADHQTTLWDLAVEEDAEGGKDASQPDVPPQLLFIHQVTEWLAARQFAEGSVVAMVTLVTPALPYA